MHELLKGFVGHLIASYRISDNYIRFIKYFIRYLNITVNCFICQYIYLTCRTNLLIYRLFWFIVIVKGGVLIEFFIQAPMEIID